MADTATEPEKPLAAGKDAIVAAAAECFRVSGFSATSIDDVAQSIGATKGMVYHYYRSKVELFFDVHRVGMAINLNSIEPVAMSDAPALQRFEKMANLHLSNILNWFSYQRVVMQGVEMHLSTPTTPQQRQKLRLLMEERERYENLFRKVLVDGREERVFSFRSASFASKAVLGILNNPVLWYKPSEDRNNEGKQQIIEEFADFALATILPR